MAALRRPAHVPRKTASRAVTGNPMAGTITRIKRLLPKAVQKSIDRHASFLVDSKTWLKPVPVSTLILRTLRYRTAALGYPLTANEKRLIAFKNKHRGERVFIIGNGPSLNKCDLSLLGNEYSFGVNSIFLKDGFMPTYYVVEDTFVAEDRHKEIHALRGTTKFFGNYLRYCIPESPETVWMNVRADYGNYPNFPNFSKNAARELWVGGTVIYLCLQLAYFMGFSEVDLIGIDHSYTIPTDAEISNVRETGADILSNSGDPNHFHPDYFGKGYRWHDPKVDRMERAYVRALQAFGADGRIIRNATVGGKLEVFERVNYKDLF